MTFNLARSAGGLLASAACLLVPVGPRQAAAQEDLPVQPAAAAPMADAPFERRVSYALGRNIGRDMKSNGVPVDVDALAKGIADALTGAPPQLTDDECREVLAKFQKDMQQKAEARMADVAKSNAERGAAFLAENGKKEGVTTTDSGLQYKVLESGDGASPTARDTVRCHYHGTLTTGDVFDSSYDRGQPAEFPVGGVIAGWTEALQLMKVGDKWEVYLPSEIAYGARGAGGAIGPNETLVFTIELLDIVN